MKINCQATGRGITLGVLLLLSYHVIGQVPTSAELSRAYRNGRCDILRLSELNTEASADAKWLYALALCEKQSGQFRASKRHLLAADSLGLDVSRPSYFLNLAIVDAQLGNQDLAIASLSRAIALGLSNHRLLDQAYFDPIRGNIEFDKLRNQLLPSFDTWTSVFLFVALQALFVCIVLFNLKGGNASANRILGTLMLVFSVILFSYVLYCTRYNSIIPYLNAWFHPLIFLTGPLFYLYIRNLIEQRPFSRNDLIHFIPPALIAVLIHPFLLAAYSSSSTIAYSPISATMVAFGTNSILKVVYLGGYIAAAGKLYYKSETGHLKNWFRYVLISFMGYYLTIIAYYVLVNFSFFNPTWDYMISFAMSFFVFVISFLGYIYPQALAGIPLKAISNPFKYRNSGLTESAELHLRDQLMEAMEDKELYRFEISLDDLADKVNSNRHSVSQVINKYFQMNYFEFVNKYRVDYVKELLLDPEHSKTPIINLAYDAGFNNKVTFNKAFKKHAGCTPMSYRATKGKIKESS